MQWVVPALAAEQFDGTQESANAIKAMCDQHLTGVTTTAIAALTAEVLTFTVTNWNNFGEWQLEVPAGSWLITQGFAVLGPFDQATFDSQWRALGSEA